MINWLQQRFLAPKTFFFTSGIILPWCIALFGLIFTYGLVAGLLFAPPDYQQGNGFRLIYVHVPSALASMGIYSVMAICGIITLVWRIKVAAICMSCSAPLGASFTLLALITGSLWGKPMWGTWWIWDARLTSVLILFFIYLGFMVLHSVIDDTEQRDQACSILAILGLINLPIIHYSVYWWNTLHQGSTITQFSKPLIAPAMLYPLLAMIMAFFLFYLMVLIIKMRTHILKREMKAQWIKEIIT